ncbi:Remorin 4.1 [Cardamine amara subsp. amara]|uniref:Remorin 4.1 n=1 Tax=Cardamine amara subsp. amara TaxID=228776 RepID=A0ABD1BHX6_CARAN
MRSVVEDNNNNKGWLGPATPEISNGNGFEFQKGANRTPNHHRSTMGKPAPSKWDDAQKWLSGVGFARGGGGGEKSHHSRSCKPRNSNADDLRLIASASQREREGEDQYVEYDDDETAAGRPEVETKNVDCGESVWRKDSINPTAVIRSVCVRDMGTEMTPIGSQEPSRTATPVRATTPVGRSPVTSPVRGSQRGEAVRMATETVIVTEARSVASNNNENISSVGENKKAMNAMEARAMAWDEAERAKFMARYKREEVKIQGWENHEKRKAEMEMKKIEVKAERMKARAEEKLANKLAATKRIAEERRANAEAKLNEKAVKTSEKADYIRRSGHLPSSLSFSIKLPSCSCCWCQ